MTLGKITKENSKMGKYIKLGVPFDDIDLVTEDIQKLLQLTFTYHESGYWGIYNSAQISESESIRILYNFVDDDWQEEDHKDCLILIELNQLTELEKMMKFLCENLSYLVPIHFSEVEYGKFSRTYTFEEDGSLKLVHEYIYKQRS